MRKTFLIVIAFLFAFATEQMQAQFRIISYNVENLFDTEHDSLNLDYDFLPDGKYRWSRNRYQRKIENISRVIANINGWGTAAVVGLCEVENSRCLNDLLQAGGLKKYGYKYLHKESPDQRGIDCALLYDPKQFHLLDSSFIAVPLPADERPTRDIVYVCGEVRLNKTEKATSRQKQQRDTLHVLMCHLPSQTGGTAETAHKRAIAHRVLQSTIDSIYHKQPFAKIVIMGDMNAAPTDHLKGMHNLMIPMEKHGEGTHKWQGVWSCLDQFFVSHSLAERAKAHIFNEYWLLEEDRQYGGDEPLRSYKYLTWQPSGCSDHLPIYLDLLPAPKR